MRYLSGDRLTGQMRGKRRVRYNGNKLQRQPGKQTQGVRPALFLNADGKAAVNRRGDVIRMSFQQGCFL